MPDPPGGLELVLQDDAELLHRSPEQVDRTTRRIARLGVDRVRITAGWSELAPEPRSRRRPAFDDTNLAHYRQEGVARLDHAIRSAEAAGLEVMVDVAFWAPRWAVARGIRGNRQRWEPDPLRFGRFARAVAERYDGDGDMPAVRLWTTWNEPNHPGFLLPQWRRARDGEWRPASPHHYRRMHAAAYDALKDVSHENVVLLGGTAARGGERPGTRRGVGPLRFLRELACLDDRLEPLDIPECEGFEPLRADGFSHHPYSLETTPEARTPDPDDAPLGELDGLASLLGELHERDRIESRLPLYLTEYGYESNPPDPGRGVSPQTQAQYIGRALRIAWRRDDVRMFAQFLLRDIGPNPAFPPGSPGRWRDFQTGVFTHGGAAKPAAQALRLPFWAELSGEAVVVFGRALPRSDDARVVVERRAIGPGGDWQELDALRAEAGGFFERRVPYESTSMYRFRTEEGEASVPVPIEAPGG